MNRTLASALTIVSTAAAALAFAAMASGKAHADDITVDTAPFASTRTRAQVQSEVTGRAEQLRVAAAEWSMQLNQAPRPESAITREQARDEYIAARGEVRALTAEDSGSSYLASLPRRADRAALLVSQQ